MGDEDLENPDNWNFDKAEKRPGTKTDRVVVSVAFRGEDFDRVSECAEQLGERMSEFIREAALDRVNALHEMVTVATFSGSLGAVVFTERRLPETRGPATAVRTDSGHPVTA